jgi:CBS domain-containing protein
MASTVRDIMTTDITTLTSGDSLVEAARRMRDADAGDVLVVDDGQLRGIVTDRDIVTGAIADGQDPDSTSLSQVCSSELVTVSPDDDVRRAVELMRERAVRRLPVVEGGKAVGIVSLGDLAVERDPDSALAEISAAAPNQ